MKATVPANDGRPRLSGPGALRDVTLNPYRSGRRVQELAFQLARDLTRHYADQSADEIPTHVLFPQVVRIVDRYLRERVRPLPPAEIRDVFLAPYYGWVIERLTAEIHSDTASGEQPELPRYESNRGPGSTVEVDFWTSRQVREVERSHVSHVVADTQRWEQSAAYVIDTHPRVQAFVKNAGLGFAVPYLHNGQPHDYVPDFIVRLRPGVHLVLEVKGYDPLKEVKGQAAERWVSAVNADAKFGRWQYGRADSVADVGRILDGVSAAFGRNP
jgi:type III restriction enzyme